MRSRSSAHKLGKILVSMISGDCRGPIGLARIIGGSLKIWELTVEALTFASSLP